jgi:glycosyltransferase involved in cell wall biosynthesis
MFFSIIIPVFNRPNEIDEMLQSISNQTYKDDFEVIIVEDGSTTTSEDIVVKYQKTLNLQYFKKPNTGPGDSRNFGMKIAKGDYFLIFDSDCVLPPYYLENVSLALNKKFVDCFGGPDAALADFSNTQKAINFAMTSFLTTGGIRGGSQKIDKFQPRSFNMGISKNAFLATNGFGNIHPGEDPDLSIRLWELGFETDLFTNAFVYHKRRIDWNKFQIQVNKFGKARPILNNWYPKHAKLVFWFPSLFCFGFIFALLLLLLKIPFLIVLYCVYFVLIFTLSAIKNRSSKIGLLSIKAVIIQFYGYGTGFMSSFYKIKIKKIKPEVAFPELFFKK